MTRWVSRLAAAICITAIARGLVLWLGLDKWIAARLQGAESSAPVEALTWVVAGVFGLVILIFWPRIVDGISSLLSPMKLNRPFIRVINDTIIFNPANPKMWSAKYLKAGLTASRKITNCQVRVVGITRSNNGVHVKHEQFDPVSLGWASTPDCAKSVEIPQGIERHYDILKCSELTQTLHFCNGVLRPNGLDEFFREAGTYRIELAISADEIRTKKLSVEVIWSGNWTEVSIRQAA